MSMGFGSVPAGCIDGANMLFDVSAKSEVYSLSDIFSPLAKLLVVLNRFSGLVFLKS